MIGEPLRDVHVVLRIAVGHRRHQMQVGAIGAQRVDFFLRLRIRHHDYRAIAQCIGNHRNADPGIAGGSFHDGAARAEFATGLGGADDTESGAILD